MVAPSRWLTLPLYLKTPSKKAMTFDAFFRPAFIVLSVGCGNYFVKTTWVPPEIYFEMKISNSCRITQVARCDFLKLLTLQAQNTAIGVTGRKLSDLLLQITKYKSLESKLIDIFSGHG